MEHYVTKKNPVTFPEISNQTQLSASILIYDYIKRNKYSFAVSKQRINDK